MASQYAAAMERLTTQLAAAVPANTVTRTYREFTQFTDAELVTGVYTVISGGVRGYGYEATPQFFDGPDQTALGQFHFSIVGQTRVSETATGEQIEAAEFALFAPLEAFADAGINDDTLKDLLLLDATFSQQLEAPYCWVKTDWRLRLFH